MKVIGMDGGGGSLKISCISDYEIKSKVYPYGVNLTSMSEDMLISIFNEVKRDFGQTDIIAGGFSGLGDPLRKRKLQEILDITFSTEKKILMTDVQAVYDIVFGKGKGVVIICGTGSIVYGQDGCGNEYRNGGWGHLFADEASAYWFSKEIIRHALLYHDGLYEYDPVFDELLSFFNVKEYFQLVNLQNDKNFKALISSFSAAALSKDSKLVDMLVENGSEILFKRVKEIEKNIKDLKEIIFFGGVFKASKFSNAISKKLLKYSTKIFKDDVSIQLAKKYYNEYKF